MKEGHRNKLFNTKARETVSTQLYLPQNLHDNIIESANELGLTKNALATIILLAFLERYEYEENMVFGVMEMPRGDNRTRLQVYISEEAKVQLLEISRKQKCSVNWLANLAFNTFIQNYSKSGTKVFFDILDKKYR